MPELPNFMEAELVRPDTDHTPKRDEYGYDVRDDELCERSMDMRDDSENRAGTIFFVLIFQYLWIYQKPSVLEEHVEPVHTEGLMCIYSPDS